MHSYTLGCGPLAPLSHTLAHSGGASRSPPLTHARSGAVRPRDTSPHFTHQWPRKPGPGPRLLASGCCCWLRPSRSANPLIHACAQSRLVRRAVLLPAPMRVCGPRNSAPQGHNAGHVCSPTLAHSASLSLRVSHNLSPSKSERHRAIPACPPCWCMPCL